MSSLPVDSVLPDLQRALSSHCGAVLQAPPGAGKTTRVPLALLASDWLDGQRIVMLEPRRLAATNAARFMAKSLGQRVGETVGYAIRYERRSGPGTRIEVVTEGILTRRLQSDPELSGVGLVIFDEFHERSLHSDLALALCRDAQMGLRDDLRILVMSATLEGGPVAHLLGEAPVVTSEGRRHPVEVRYLAQASQGSVSERSAAAIRRALRETQGDILAFLPGAGEIRRCRELLQDLSSPDLLLCPLYADLPFEEQERAILPAGRRKVVLATNIAETSLTIEGVATVVDCGLARQPRFHPGTGLSRLETVRISRASAEQRTGRAGRLGPGVCYRLWTEGEHGSLLPFTPPEIRSADLAPLALELARWGVSDAASLAWLEPPPEGALAAARDFLTLLGALDRRGRITLLGEEISAFPLHPRLGRLLVEARHRGCEALGCDLAALLSERDVFRRERVAQPGTGSDLLDRLEALQAWRGRREVRPSVDAGACAAVERASRHFARLLRLQSQMQEMPDEEELARLLAPAWPDRIAGEREPGSGRYLLSGGQGGRLSPRSGVRKGSFLVALEVAGGSGGEWLIDQANALSRDLLEEALGAHFDVVREVIWSEKEERVQAREVRRLGALEVSCRPVAAGADEDISAVVDGLRRLGLQTLNWTPAAEQFAARVRFMARVFPEEGWPDLSAQALSETTEAWLAPFLEGVRSRADLERFTPLAALQALLPWRLQHRLEEAAPTHLSVPSGHRIALDYGTGDAPVMAVKLQEMFGLAETPRVGEGRIPVVLHLLSPARRPIQVTSDLRSFWDQTYPEVKKELKGRYPKHPWPEDPWSAEATRKTTRRR